MSRPTAGRPTANRDNDSRLAEMIDSRLAEMIDSMGNTRKETKE